MVDSSQSLEQQALDPQNQQQTSSIRNNQQTANFMNALKQTGAGSNNTFMNASPQAQQSASPLMNNNMNLYGGGANGNQTINWDQPMRQAQQLAPVQGHVYQQQSVSPYAQVTPTNYQAPVQQGSFNYGALPQNMSSAQSLNPGVLAATPQSQPMQSMQQIQNTQAYAPAYQQTQQAYNPYAASSLSALAGQYAMPAYNQNTLNQSYLVSDERAKEEIAPASSEVRDFLGSIGAWSYEYRDKADGEGRFVSPMAQELEQTDIGKSAVVNLPGGKKGVNYSRLQGIQLSAMADLHQRMKLLEDKYIRSNLKGK